MQQLTNALLLPTLMASATVLSAQDTAIAPPDTFSIINKEGEHIDVQRNKKTVLRLMIANDTSTPKRAHQTYKVFAHVMDPTDPEGKRRLTKGAGDKFTHHRGIFIGWSRAQVEGIGKVDTWHMKGNRQIFRKILTAKTGPKSATLTVAIDWRTEDKKLIVNEERTFVVHAPNADGSTTIDMASKITATTGRTILRGDPEHAGIQFRAHEAVVKNKSAKYMFVTGAKPKKKDYHLPWAAMTFKVGERSHMVQHMSHPSLPKNNVYSAYRDYGRFGCYFQKTLEKGTSATFQVRIQVSSGGFPEKPEETLNGRFVEYAKAGK